VNHKKNENTDDPVLVTIKETKRRTGFGRTKIYELIKDDTLKSVKIGGSRRVVMSSIRNLAKSAK
jgi:excisionase family DNA binding protein